MVLVEEYVPSLRKDYAWYESSNFMYTECVDRENELKDLYVMYKNGSVYLYHDVNVNDYLFIRNAASQGKEAYQRLKPYKYEKVGDVNPDDVMSIGSARALCSHILYVDDGTVVMTDGKRNELCSFSDGELPTVEKTLKALGVAYARQDAYLIGKTPAV